jgi:hypothetical protein
VPALPATIDALVPVIAIVAIAVIALLLWRRHRRLAQRRAAGYRLMDCLKAYTVWIDWHRGEPLLHQEPENLSIPAPLAQAVKIKDEHFPELHRLTVQLLETHRELMKYLWEENILRMTHASHQRAHYADPRYHALRDTQDAALDSLFMRCRQLIGEGEMTWTRTRSDFNFSSGLSLPSQPTTPT